MKITASSSFNTSTAGRAATRRTRAKQSLKVGFVAVSRASRQEQWRATRVDLIFRLNAQLWATAEVYAEKGAEQTFVQDVVSARVKVMSADRFDVPGLRRR